MMTTPEEKLMAVEKLQNAYYVTGDMDRAIAFIAIRLAWT